MRYFAILYWKRVCERWRRARDGTDSYRLDILPPWHKLTSQQWVLAFNLCVPIERQIVVNRHGDSTTIEADCCHLAKSRQVAKNVKIRRTIKQRLTKFNNS